MAHSTDTRLPVGAKTGASNVQGILGIVLIGMIVSIVFWCSGRRVKTFESGRFSGGESRSLFSALSVHSSTPKYLAIDGRIFDRVKGSPPYYLGIPELNSILFVTRMNGGNMRLHLFNLGNGKDVQIETHDSGFGTGIGFQGAPRGAGADSVEYVQSNRVTVGMLGAGWKQSLVLNLDTASVERRELRYLDNNGKVTNLTVY